MDNFEDCTYDATGQYRWAENKNGYELLIDPDGKEVAFLTEPEDRIGCRDLADVVDELNHLRAQLDAAQQQIKNLTELRPMNTAPRDGRMILAQPDNTYAPMVITAAAKTLWDAPGSGHDRTYDNDDFVGWLPLPAATAKEGGES